MMSRFFGQEIEVETAGEVKEPASFRLGDRVYQVAEVVEQWHDHGFGQPPLKKRRWWQRRHITCYRVRTAEGEVFELHHERGTHPDQARRGKWYLYRQL